MGFEIHILIVFQDDFFKVTGNELKKLNLDKNIQSQQLDMLMTQKMREDAALLNKRTYSYSLIRIRMPDSDYLQVLNSLYSKVINIIRELLMYMKNLPQSLISSKKTSSTILIGSPSNSDLQMEP